MQDGRDRENRGIHLSNDIAVVGDCGGFAGQLLSARRIRVHHECEFGAGTFPHHANMILPERAGSDHGDSRHCLSSNGAIPTMAIFAEFAFASKSSLSSMRVRPASTASAVVLVSIITSIVPGPITGTSNSKCLRRDDAFTSVMFFP